MRVLHTSDWHIGKKTENMSRLAEQAAVLDEITALAQSEGVDLVIVAGDVFDTYTPPAEAEQLFYEKILCLSKDRAVVVIPGNHDDATRLTAAAPIAGKCGIYFAGTEAPALPVGKKTGRLTLAAGGEDHLVFSSDKGEAVYVALLPYPTEARFREKIPGDTYAEKITYWMNKCTAANTDGLPQILVSHLFTAGGITTEGEREISLGGAKAVDKKSFPDSAYTALGHLHKRQVVDSGRNIIYSGSILQYSFDEVNVEKSVTIFDLEGGKCRSVRAVPLNAGRRLARISAASVGEADALLKEVSDRLVELTLRLISPMSREENTALFASHPNIVSLRLDIASERRAVRERRSLGDAELFAKCYESKYGKEPDKELMELYLSLLEEGEA